MGNSRTVPPPPPGFTEDDDQLLKKQTATAAAPPPPPGFAEDAPTAAADQFDPQAAATAELAKSGVGPAAAPSGSKPLRLFRRTPTPTKAAHNLPFNPVEQAGNSVLPGVGSVAQAPIDYAETFTNPEKFGTEAQASEARRAAGSKLIGGAMEAASPLLGPAAVEAPVSTGLNLGAGVALSEAAGAIADKVGATPQEKELAKSAAMAVPLLSVAGRYLARAAGLKGEVVQTPEQTSAAAEAFGGNVGAGVNVTPEAVEIGGKVGSKTGKVRIPRKPAASPAPQIEPPTIEGESATGSQEPNNNPPQAPTQPPPSGAEAAVAIANSEVEKFIQRARAQGIPEDQIQAQVRDMVAKMQPKVQAAANAAEATAPKPSTGLPGKLAKKPKQQDAGDHLATPPSFVPGITNKTPAPAQSAQVSNEPYQLESPPQDVAVRQWMDSLAPEDKSYAQKVWQRLQTHGPEGLTNDWEPYDNSGTPNAEDIESHLVGVYNRTKTPNDKARAAIAAAGAEDLNQRQGVPAEDFGGIHTFNAPGLDTTMGAPADEIQTAGDVLAHIKSKFDAFNKLVPQEITDRINSLSPEERDAYNERLKNLEAASGGRQVQQAPAGEQEEAGRPGRPAAPTPAGSVPSAPAAAEQPTQEVKPYKEGDRVTWSSGGKQLTGTVESVDSDGTLSIDTDQVKHILGKIPIGRIEHVHSSKVQPLEAEQKPPTPEPKKPLSPVPNLVAQHEEPAPPAGFEEDVERPQPEPLTEYHNVPEEDEPEIKNGAAGLADEVYRKLKTGESLGNVTALTKMADKYFGSGWRTASDFTPKDMFDAMEAGVNKYLVERAPELMAMDAPEGLAELRKTMGLLTSQGVRTEEQITHQQFSTPPTEAYVVAKVAGIKPSDVVLEPSAGNGGLAAFAKGVGADTYVNEIADRRRKMLEEVGFDRDHISDVDGELINAMLPANVKPTVVVMNPPFSSKSSAGVLAKHSSKFGFNHVTQALQRLAPGGRLVAILGGGRDNFPKEGATFANPAANDWFKQIAKKADIKANVRIDGKEYQKYGTSYATRIVVIDKTGPTPNPGGDWPSVVKGAFDTLEEAYNALRPIAESRPNVSASPTRTDTAEAQSGSSVGAPAVETGGRPGTGRAGEQPVSGRGERPGPAGRPASTPQPAGPSGLPGTSEAGAGAGVPEGGNGSGSAANPADESPRRAEGGAPGSAERPLDDDTRRLTESPTPPEKLDLTQEGERDDREQEDTGAYVSYKPTLKGPKHPGNIVETKTMATVPLPKITYQPALPESVINEGKISAVQLESVALSGQANNTVLPGGIRASLLIGDGTGVGKGREGASILWDNWRQGRKRLMWVSKSWDLIEDALRDMKGIGASELASKMTRLDKFDAAEPIEHNGVIFTTYSTLRGGDKKGNKRIEQVKKWLAGNDNADGGYALFDESHNLKNAVTAGRTPPSQIGVAVKDFLGKLPNLRTVSLSATAASDVANLGYLDRLGLWGPGTPFPDGFNQFLSEIGSGGMSAMELVARELKAQGRYIARTLSYKGSTYDIVEHALTPEQKEVYRTAAKAWRLVQDRAAQTIETTLNGGSKARGNFLGQFYSAQQRFFNILLTTLKIPSAVELANKALAEDKSVVITLVNTNEAAQKREEQRVAADTNRDGDEPPDYDFGPKNLLIDVVRSAYPTQQWEDAFDDQGRPIKRPVVDKDGNPVQNPEAVRARDALIKELERDLKMPENPLDILVNSLGGPKKVAELTGRKKRLDASTGKLVPRGGDGVPSAKVNINEAANFQDGKKRVAILSSAADTGISLHAALDAKNQQRRFHITLQSGWSADRAMQMLGRTLRSNQKSAPEYVLLASDVAGEKRFLSSIARRLGSLGALSRGQSKALSGTDALDKFNFETNEGRSATRSFYEALMRRGTRIPTHDPGVSLDGMEILRDLGVLKNDPNRGEIVPDKDLDNVTKLLNRILALDPDVQNAVFDYYSDIFQAVVQRAIDDGTLDTGVRTIPGDEFHVREERELSTDPQSGAKTFYYPVEAKVKLKRVSLDDVDGIMEKQAGRHARMLVKAGKKEGEPDAVVVAYDAPPVVHADGRTTEASYVVHPESSIRTKLDQWKLHDYRQPKDLLNERKAEAETKILNLENRLKMYRRYGDVYAKQIEETETELVEANKAVEPVNASAEKPEQWARDLWQKQYDAAPDHQVVEHHLIGGSVLRWWNAIRQAADQRLHVLTTVDSKTGKRVVGVEIPQSAIRPLLTRISGQKSTVTADQMSVDVLKNGLMFTLEGNLQVKRARVGGNFVIQVMPPSDSVARNLQRIGLKYERGATPIYYVPTRDTFGAGRVADEKTLEALLKEYPVQGNAEGNVNPAMRMNRSTQFGPGPGAKTDKASTGLPNEVGKSDIGQVTDAFRRMAAGKNDSAAPAPEPTAASPTTGSIKDLGRHLWEKFTSGAVSKDRFDLELRDWEGSKQEAGIKVHQMLEAAKRAHPDKLVQSGMRVWMDHGGDEAAIREAADRVSAASKPAYERALKLTPDEKTTVNNLVSLHDSMLEEAQKLGMIESGVENYVMHAYKRAWRNKFWKSVRAELNISQLNPNPSFTKKRTYATYADAEEVGKLEPKFTSAFDLTGLRFQSQANAIADRALIKNQFKKKAADGRPRVVVAGGVRVAKPADEEGNGVFLAKPKVKGGDTADYVLVDHPALRRWKWVGEDENGNTVYLQGDAYVHPEIAQRLKNILGTSKFRTFEMGPAFFRVRPGQAALRISSEMKGVLLGAGGPFHQSAIIVHGLEHRVNPFKLVDLDMEDEKQRALVHGGLMAFDHRHMTDFTEGVSAHGTLVGRLPGIAQYTNYLFRSFIPRMKMTMALHALDRNIGRYGKTVPMEQIYALTADQANAAFGELNYTALARNKTFQDGMRLFLLAPDFLEARARFVGQASRGYGKEQNTALIYGALAMFTLAQAINYALHKKMYPRSPFSVIAGGHQYTLRSVQYDFWHALTDPRDFVYNRLNPTTSRTIVEWLTGRDRFGRKQSLADQLVDFVKAHVPIVGQPFINKHGTSWKTQIANVILQSVGVNEKLYRSPAEQKAMEEGGEDTRPTSDRPQSPILRKFRRRMNEGDFNRKDVDQAVRDRQITGQDRAALVKESGQSRLSRDFKQLPLKAALDVWDSMSPEERKANRAELLRKSNAEIQRYPAGKEKEQMRERVNRALAGSPSSVPGFLRKMFSGSAVTSR